MGILGLGVDIVHLPRIASLVSRRTSARLASRILSAAELSEWENLSSEDMLRQTRFLAVRWAAKEAAYKALYPRYKASWKELTVVKEDHLKPGLQYNTESTRHTGLQFHLSISHDGDYTVATVLVEN